MYYSITVLYLLYDVALHYKERKGQVEEEPDLHRLDVGGGWEAGGHREVDRGQDHHAGDVDRVHQAVLLIRHDIVGDLVNDVHEDCWEITDKENTPELPHKEHLHYNFMFIGFFFKILSHIPSLDNVLTEVLWSPVNNFQRNQSREIIRGSKDEISQGTSLTSKRITLDITEGAREVDSPLYQ